MKIFFEKYKFYLIPIAYLVFAFLFFKLAIFPILGGIKEKSEEINKKNLDRLIIEKRTEKIPEMKKDQEIILKNGDVLDMALDRNREIDFIKSIESMAEATGNEISFEVLEKADNAENSRLRKAPSKSEEKIPGEENSGSKNQLFLKIILKGDYFSLVEFVRKLENFKYWVNIVSLESKKYNSKAKSANRNVSNFFATSPEKNVSEEPGENEFIESILNAAVYVKD